MARPTHTKSIDSWGFAKNPTGPYPRFPFNIPHQFSSMEW